MAVPFIANSGAFAAWLASATAGERFFYAHADHLPDRPHKTIEAVRAAYNAGCVELVQRRMPKGTFDYIAEMRRRVVTRAEHELFRPPARA